MSTLEVVETSLSLMVLTVAAFLVARVVTTRAARRELRERPVVAVVLAIGAAIGLAAATWLFLDGATTRRLLVGGTFLATTAAVLRAGPGYGRRRGLPPGSLGLRESLDAIGDPDYYARTAERLGPVFKMSQIHQPVACITDLDIGLTLFREQADRLRQSDWAFNRLVPGGYLEYTDGETHDRLRTRLMPAFTQQNARAARSMIADAAREQLGAMARASGRGGVHPEDYLLPIAHAGLIRAVLGVSADHPEYEDLRARFTDLNRPLDLFLPIPRSSRNAYDSLVASASRLAASVGVAGSGVAADSVLHGLATAHREVTNDESVLGNLVLMVKEGGIMTRGMLRWVVKMLADYPEAADRIRAAASDPAELERRCCAFALETIRHFESPYLYRRVERAVDVEGFRVPRGWHLRLCLTEAHADPGAFANPGAFSPARFTEDAPAEAFCPFGAGSRSCPGEDIALEIARVTIEIAALEHDITRVGDGPAWRINRHWGLWRPSLRLMVRVEQRAA